MQRLSLEVQLIELGTLCPLSISQSSTLARSLYDVHFMHRNDLLVGARGPVKVKPGTGPRSHACSFVWPPVRTSYDHCSLPLDDDASTPSTLGTVE
jgi:hypothetical protein